MLDKWSPLIFRRIFRRIRPGRGDRLGLRRRLRPEPRGSAHGGMRPISLC